MDTAINIGSYILTGLGALIVALTGLAAGLRLLAPKTDSTLDDRALSFLDKVVSALRWVDEKLMALLGMVSRTDVARPTKPAP